MQIAIIAPNPAGDLAQLPAEVQTVVNAFSQAGHRVTIVTGDDATQAGLARQGASLSADLVWYAGHSSAAGIVLNDRAMPAAEFAQWIAMAQAEQLILNGCFTAEHTTTIQRYADVEITASIDPAGIGDERAATFAAYLARAYVESAGDLRQATERATAAGAAAYRYFPAGRRLARMPHETDEKALSNQVDALIRALNGEWGNPGLIRSIEGLRADFAQYREADQARWQNIERRVNSLEQRQPIHMSPASATAALLIVAAFALAVVIVLRGLAGA